MTRIDSLHELVPPGSRVADIGTDRALLPRRLLASRRASHCIATERDAPRAERARRGVRDLLDDARFELRAGDGLSVLEAADRIDVVVIAGLGGERISAILEHGRLPALGVRRLVLQPQTALAAMRSWVGTHGFGIVDERLVREGDRFFTIVAADLGVVEDGAVGCALLAREDLLEVGPCLARSGSPHVQAYWRAELARMEEILAMAGSGKGRGRRDATERRDLARRVLAALAALAGPESMYSRRT